MLAMVEREGDVRFRMMERVTADRLAGAIAANASVTARLVTGELNAYTRVGREFLGGRHVVAHSRR
jgi:hypothetical protein